MSFLSEDFNLLIEITKSVLFARNIKYPPVKNEHGLANILRVQLKRPANPNDLYEVSVAFLGPWETLPIIPVLLYHTFQGFEKRAADLQDMCDGTIVTQRKHKLKPNPCIASCAARFHNAEWQWIMDLKEHSEMQTGALEEMIELVFKTQCAERLEEMVAENYKKFLAKTFFMFYDITFEFSYWGEPFKRAGIDLPVPWSTSRKLKKFLRHRLGQPVSLGSAWSSQDELNDEMQPLDVTAVNFGIAGESECLPVWVLGPSGIPIPEFSSTLFMQLICQAAEIPPDVTNEYIPPAGLPPPDICLTLPPQHKLSKHTNFLVIVILLPIQYRQFHLHCQLVQDFDAISAHYWDEIVETIREVVLHPSEISVEFNDFKLSRGMATALGSIIRQSFNRDFTEKCYKLLEVNNSIDAQDSMEEYLLEYLKEKDAKPEINRDHLYHPPRAAHLPPKDSIYTNEQWFAMTEEEKEEARILNICVPVRYVATNDRDSSSEQIQSISQSQESLEPIPKKLRLEKEADEKHKKHTPVSYEETQLVSAANSPSNQGDEVTAGNSPCTELDDSFETQMISELNESSPADSALPNSWRETGSPNFTSSSTSFIDE